METVYSLFVCRGPYVNGFEIRQHRPRLKTSRYTSDSIVYVVSETSLNRVHSGRCWIRGDHPSSGQSDLFHLSSALRWGSTLFGIPERPALLTFFADSMMTRWHDPMLSANTTDYAVGRFGVGV